MRFNLLFLFCTLVLVSCKNESDTPIAKPQKFDKIAYADSLKDARENSGSPVKSKLTTKKDSVQTEKKTPEFSEKTDTIFVKIQNGKAKIDTLKQPRQRMVFVLDSDTAKKLKLKISTQDTIANLRISQIIDSKGNSDGPFGRESEYKVLEKGLHKIIVSESQMVGEPWGGKFRFEVRLGW